MNDHIKQNIKQTTDEVESQIVGTNFKIGKKLGAGKLTNLFFLKYSLSKAFYLR